MTRRWLLLTCLALGLVLTLSAMGTIAGEVKRVAALLPGSAGDQSWNSYGFKGLQSIRDGIGADIAFSENVPSAEQVDAFSDYARNGFNLVFGHSGRFLDAATRVGARFPETRFIVIAGTGGNGKNVDSVDVARDQFAYVEGVIAGLMTKTNKVGIVAGLQGLLAIDKTVGGFRLGVNAVNPEAEVTAVYLSSMEDVAMAKEAVFPLAEYGADVVLGILNRGHIGIIEAAKEKGVYTVGRSIAHTKIAPDHVLTNTVEDWPSIYLAMAKLESAGELKGEYRVFGYHTPNSNGAQLLHQEGVSYNPVIPEAVLAKVKQVQDDIASGRLQIEVSKHDARGGK